MYANNEVGTIEPIAELARVVKDYDRHIVFHTDAVQAAGALDLNVDRLGVDLLSLAAHKFYGPKGVGALYVRPRTPFVGQMLGGSQERNRRAGTENVAGAVGLANALYARLRRSSRRATPTSRACATTCATSCPRASRRAPHRRLDTSDACPNSFSCCLERVEGEAVLIQLDLNGIAASSGSACTTGSLEPSHVLTAMGMPSDVARGSLRLTLGHDNTPRQTYDLLDDAAAHRRQAATPGAAALPVQLSRT